MNANFQKLNFLEILMNRLPLVSISSVYRELGSYRKTAKLLRMPLTSTFRAIKKLKTVPQISTIGRPKLIYERTSRRIIRAMKKTPLQNQRH